jgi:hypothetical protein
MEDHPCRICGTPDSEKPMCFRKEDWCSENHRKLIAGEDADPRALVP